MNNDNNNNPVTAYDIVVDGESYYPDPFCDRESAIERAKVLSWIYGGVVSVYATPQRISSGNDDDPNRSLIYEVDNGEDVPQNETRGGGY